MRPLQMDDELQPHFQARGSFAENGADIEQAEAAHLKKIAQHAWATTFDRAWRDPCHFHDIIRDQAMAARNEFKRQLRFAGT